MKKVLNIVPYQYLPFFSGGQKFIAQFNQSLAEQCVLHVAGTGDNDASLAKNYSFYRLLKKSRSRYLDISSFFRIKKLIKEQEIDTVIIEHPYLGWLGWLLKKSCKIQLIVHTHNIEYERFRTLSKSWWSVLKLYESWVLRKADAVFCISEEDRQWMIQQLQLKPEKCLLVPYGINQKSMPLDKQQCKELVCSKHGFNPQHSLLFFNGLLDYEPNLDALHIILEQINPLLLQSSLQYNILVAGKRLPAELNELKAWKSQHIHYAGFVDDIELYFKSADLFLNPVQSGGGVKTKMIESIAFGTTVISTKSGAIGIEENVCDGKLVTGADNDWINFTTAIVDNSKTSTETPAAYYGFYYWENIIKKIISSLA